MREFDLRALYACADAFDAEGFASFFAPTGTLRFAGGPVATGRDEIVPLLEGFFAQIGGMHHRFGLIFRDGDQLAFEHEVVYTRKDGREVVVPAASLYTLSDKGIVAGRVYSDMAVVFD